MRRVTTGLALAFLLLVPTAGWCDLPYIQNFEDLKLNAPNALSDDGWLVWENVYYPDWTYFYGMSWDTPNGGEQFCALVDEQGGEEQGLQQLSVYNNYWNEWHDDGYWIEVNVYQEHVIDAADAGSIFLFNFHYKKGNIELDSFAKAFIKVIDPDLGYAEIYTDWFDIPTDDEYWHHSSESGEPFSIQIDGAWEGKFLQFGFMNTATYKRGSGVFYDNITFASPAASNLDIFPETCDHSISKRPTAPIIAALTGGPGFDVNDVNVNTLALEDVAPYDTDIDDVVGQYLELGPTCVCPDPLGPDGPDDLVMYFDAAEVVAAAGAKRPGFYVLTLTGKMNTGESFKYQDCIEIPSPKPDK